MGGSGPERLRVSVVVCCFTAERLAGLTNCLASLRGQTRPADEILLVIDHNLELFEKARTRFPDVRVIGNDHARGCAGARNCGASHATGSVIAFLDDDAYADPDWLEKMLEPYHGSSIVAGTGGRARPQWPINRRPFWFPAEFDWVVGCSYRGMPEQPSAVRNLWGPISFRRELFQELGGFDESIGRVGTVPLGCEDTEFCIRMQCGHPDATLLYLPGACVAHVVDPERATPRYFLKRCYAEGLSKAAVTDKVGAVHGLATERVYSARVLPSGIARCIRVAASRDPRALTTLTMIVLGFVATTSGYLHGRLRSLRGGARRAPSMAQPVRRVPPLQEQGSARL